MRVKKSCLSVSNQRGFTLVELLMVIAILGVLASIAIKTVQEERMKAQDAKTIAFMRNLLTRAETDLPIAPGGLPIIIAISGGTALGPDYPEMTLNPGMTLWMWYDEGGNGRWDFYLAHEGGKLGFYFWIPSDTCPYDVKPAVGLDPDIASDKLVPTFDTRNNYDTQGYRTLLGY